MMLGSLFIVGGYVSMTMAIGMPAFLFSLAHIGLLLLALPKGKK